MKSFKMKHVIFEDVTLFSEDNAPSWLSQGGLQGSTMDNRWFFEQHVLTLKVGQSVFTDFHIITRTK
jgi:hypothetical protein